MATGRTHLKHARFYADGYDLSGFVRQFGPLAVEFEAKADAALSDEVLNVLLDHGMLGVGELNAFLDNTANGLHAVTSGAGVKRVVLAALGIRSAPAQGDPAFCGEFAQLDYKAAPEMGGYVAANVSFGNADAVGAALAYAKPWGVLLHAKNAETAVNAASGVDDYGAATTRGGFLCYQLFSSNGTVTLKAQDSADNASFADLSGATSGSQDASSTPKAGIVALGTTATVRRYLRWQLVFGTATTATFALALVRG